MPTLSNISSGRKNIYEDWLSAPLGAKPTYDDKYAGEMQELYGKISGRGPFRYDAGKDPLFQSYKDNYVRQGKMAMKDTMGQASALTGGYGSTYGQQVGQQAYDAYLQNLNDVIPQLYGMAMDQYNAEGDRLMQQYGMLGDLRDRKYGMYRDALGDWQSDREFRNRVEEQQYNRDFNERQFAHQQAIDAYNQAMEQQKFAYQQQLDAYNQRWQRENRDYERQWNQENRDYERAWQQQAQDYQRQWNEDQRSYERQLTADTMSYDRQQANYKNLYSAIAQSGYSPSDEELAAAGMSRAAANAIADEYRRGADLDERGMVLKENAANNVGGGGGYSSGPMLAYEPDRGWYEVGPSYSSDIWDDAISQYQQYGYQQTSDDLANMYKNGDITKNQYVIGKTSTDFQWTKDHAENVAKAAVSKQQTKTPVKTAGEDWREVRKKLGI